MSGDTLDRSPGIRASDTEREWVVTKLQREFAVGRLTMAELEQRIDAAQAAATRAGLRTLTADLPAAPGPASTALAAPSHCLMCLLWYVCRPAGLVYLLLSRLGIRAEQRASTVHSSARTPLMRPPPDARRRDHEAAW
jgi:Domain of unknown function (DUF1707)